MSREDDFDDLDDYLDEVADEILSAPQADSDAKNPADFEKQMADVLASMGPQDSDTKDDISKLISDLNLLRDMPEMQPDKSDKAQEFQDIISSTLGRLKESGHKVDDDLKKQQNPDALLQELMDSLSLGDGADDDQLADLVSGMMKQLSSKEVLYEPLKELNAKYPQWLKENPGQEQYEKQAKIVAQIVAIYEKPDFTEELYGDEVGQLIEEMQECGNPPEELMDGGGEGLPFDSDVVPDQLEKDLEDTCKQT